MSLKLEKAITNLTDNWYDDELKYYLENFNTVDNREALENIPTSELEECNYKDLRNLIDCKIEVNLMQSDKDILANYVEILWEYISDKDIPEIMSRYEQLEGVK